MQNTYAQNKEDLFVLNYFDDYKGTLLEIGANDGVTLSNSKLLIENGWKAHLVEPGSVFNDLSLSHALNQDRVICYNFGMGEKDECVWFWESGAHIPNGIDNGLVSTCNFQETLRWPNVEFTSKEIQIVSFKTFMWGIGWPKLDFISIDVEGMEMTILQQIDLEAVGCRCLCIEYNSNPDLLKLFSDYCVGYKLELINAENLVFCK